MLKNTVSQGNVIQLLMQSRTGAVTFLHINNEILTLLEAYEALKPLRKVHYSKCFCHIGTQAM